MTAPTETVELPKLPEGFTVQMTPDPNASPAVIYFEQDMQDYARAAVLADRASRSPVVGAVGGEAQACKRCDGSGQLRRVGSTPMGRPIMEVDNCPVCNGSGASPTAAGPMTARMLTDKETMDAYCVPWPEGGPFPKWMARMDAVIRKFCEVNGIGVSPTGSPEGEVSHG